MEAGKVNNRAKSARKEKHKHGLQGSLLLEETFLEVLRSSGIREAQSVPVGSSFSCTGDVDCVPTDTQDHIGGLAEIFIFAFGFHPFQCFSP